MWPGHVPYLPYLPYLRYAIVYNYNVYMKDMTKCYVLMINP